MKRFLPSLLTLTLFVNYLPAADIEPTLGKKGKVLLDEKFDGSGVPAGWTKNAGALTVRDGALRISELASDKHAGAFRKPLPVQNVAIQLDFQFERASMLHVGFDPAAGELNKQGHLYSIIINPKTISILEHNDKSNPNSKPKTHVSKASQLKDGQWYTLLIENKGEDVVVQLQGHETLRAKSEDFRVKKPGLVFRVGSGDNDGVLIDNLRVWSLD